MKCIFAYGFVDGVVKGMGPTCWIYILYQLRFSDLDLDVTKKLGANLSLVGSLSLKIDILNINLGS